MALGTGCGVLANMLKHVVLSTPLLAYINPMLLTLAAWLLQMGAHMFTERGNLHSW